MCVCVCVCVFSLLSGRISTLRDETGAVSKAFVATYFDSKTRTASAGHVDINIYKFSISFQQIEHDDDGVLIQLTEI